MASQRYPWEVDNGPRAYPIHRSPFKPAQLPGWHCEYQNQGCIRVQNANDTDDKKDDRQCRWNRIMPFCELDPDSTNNRLLVFTATDHTQHLEEVKQAAANRLVCATYAPKISTMMDEMNTESQEVIRVATDMKAMLRQNVAEVATAVGIRTEDLMTMVQVIFQLALRCASNKGLVNRKLVSDCQRHIIAIVSGINDNSQCSMVSGLVESIIRILSDITDMPLRNAEFVLRAMGTDSTCVADHFAVSVTSKADDPGTITVRTRPS